MPALDQVQIAERIELYQRYADAQVRLAEVQGQVPEEYPMAFRVEWDGITSDAMRRVEFVIKRAWPALRKAVLADAQKELDDAEAAVLAFERGEDVAPA